MSILDTLAALHLVAVGAAFALLGVVVVQVATRKHDGDR